MPRFLIVPERYAMWGSGCTIYKLTEADEEAGAVHYTHTITRSGHGHELPVGRRFNPTGTARLKLPRYYHIADTLAAAHAVLARYEEIALEHDQEVKRAEAAVRKARADKAAAVEALFASPQAADSEPSP